jgi:predicted NBD/HSP70 family sugar kinase
MSAGASPSGNVARVLRLLWLHPGISRVEMAARLGLNRSTVSVIIQELLERKLVKPIAFADVAPGGGRKKVQLTINPQYGCAGGVQVHADFLRAVLVDMAGRVIHRSADPGAVTGKNLLRRLERAGRQLEQRARQLGLRLLGVGCGLPGIVDPGEGTLLQSIPLGILREEPIAPRLAPLLDHPVFVANDAHCCCWGELACSRETPDNFLFILAEWRRAPERVGALMTSIGVGVTLGRQVHYGRGFSAGEFRSIDWRPGNASQFSLTDDEIAAAAHDRGLYLRMVRELARNAALVVHVLDLDRVYLGGFFDARDVETQGAFTEEIRRNWTYPTPPMCEVAFSTNGDHAVASGAAGLILERAFADPGALEGGRAPGLALLMGG